jgi:hypothetical protein
LSRLQPFSKAAAAVPETARAVASIIGDKGKIASEGEATKRRGAPMRRQRLAGRISQQDGGCTLSSLMIETPLPPREFVLDCAAHND